MVGMYHSVLYCSNVTGRHDTFFLTIYIYIHLLYITRCLGCEDHSDNSGSECFEEDMLVVNQCGSSQRQRFLYDQEIQEKGRIMPYGSPNLCLTLEDNDDIRLQECSDDNENQIFGGFQPQDDFFVSLNNWPDWCLALKDERPGKDAELITVACDNDHPTSLWHIMGDIDDYDAKVIDVEPTQEPTQEAANEDESDSSCGECFRITQDGSGINVMVRPVSTHESVEDFYGYNRDNYSFNGDDVVPLVPNHSLIFLHRNEKDCELSFVIVHDSKKSEECSGGTVVMYISGDLEDSIVQDGRDSPSDEYTYDEETDETECYWEWNWQGGCKKRTDGIAQLWDTSERECIRVTPNFIEGIDAWEFVSGPSGDPENYIPLDLETPLSICTVDC